jgi:hypothetical protein
MIISTIVHANGAVIPFCAVTAMEPKEPADITGLLRLWSSGDQSALDRLTVHLYEELHHMAGDGPVVVEGW